MAAKFAPRKHPLLYEVNTAAWLFELTRKLGKPVRLRDVPPEEWDRFKELGMDYIWLLGVWTRSPAGRQLNIDAQQASRVFNTVLPSCELDDILGSCYSISSFEVDPLIGSLKDIDFARDELHCRGIGLILDFIPNHAGTDHLWLTEHPDYFIQVTPDDYRRFETSFFPVAVNGQTIYFAHGRDPYIHPWTDTVQYNYFNPALRAALLDQIGQVAAHCDGLRCDMAMLVLNDIFQKTWGWANRSPVYHEPPREEFWQQATHRFPDLVWIAEAYWDTEYRLQQLGFDYVYDKRLYDRLKDSNPHEVYLHLTADVSFQSRLVRYIENHDELRSVLAFGNERVKPAVTLMAGLPGLKMYYNGQLEGRKVRIPVQLRQAMREDGDSELFQFYTKLLAATGEPVFHDGSWQLKEVKSDGDAFSSNVIAYTWQLEGRLAFVVANLGAEPTRVIVHFQDQVSESADYDLEERLTGRQSRLNGKILAHPGFRLALPAYGANVFDIMPSSSLRGFILPEGKDAISDGAK